jgi:hypothetical protein
MKFIKTVFICFVGIIVLVACISGTSDNSPVGPVYSATPIITSPSITESADPLDFPVITLAPVITPAFTCSPHITVEPTVVILPTAELNTDFIEGVFISQGQPGPNCVTYYRLLRFYEDGLVISAFISTSNILDDRAGINKWLDRDKDSYFFGVEEEEIARGEYRLVSEAIEINIFQRVIYVSSSDVSIGDYFHQTYSGAYFSNKLFFDTWNVDGQDLPRSTKYDEYEYTRLNVEN